MSAPCKSNLPDLLDICPKSNPGATWRRGPVEVRGLRRPRRADAKPYTFLSVARNQHVPVMKKQ
ncbi:hypothetical protein DM46_1330 [Burkholderia mallei]|nr:hypothetical protein DM46_1330 [Burkholderia mallei]